MSQNERTGLPKRQKCCSMAVVGTSRSNSKTAKWHDGIFGGYNNLGTYEKAFDEMFDGQGNVRGPYKGIHTELAPSDVSELEARADALGRAFID